MYVCTLSNDKTTKKEKLNNTTKLSLNELNYVSFYIYFILFKALLITWLDRILNIVVIWSLTLNGTKMLKMDSHVKGILETPCVKDKNLMDAHLIGNQGCLDALVSFISCKTYMRI